MFVVPLNADWFFKKVFSNKRIAKHFLQDLLDVTITEIVLLSTEHKLSNDSVLVKFDFRCKIKGQYCIIEMQQKYKFDVPKRFFMYHSTNTALQLEDLKPLVLTKPNGETYTEKDYSGVEPVITVVWMVDDSLNFTEDVIAFSTLPEAVKDFITDLNLWSQPLETILAEREKMLQILNNTTKDLDFFAQNRLIFAFQKNIVKNKKLSKYFKWFIFAQLSKNINNQEQDFSQFKNDDVMAEVLRRLKKDELSTEEQKMAASLDQHEFYYLRMLQIKDEEMNRLKEKAEKAEKAEHQKLLKAVRAFLLLGKDITDIAGILELSIEETTELIEQIDDKKH